MIENVTRRDRSNPRIDDRQVVHRPQQQARADHDDDGERDFGHDERAANVMAGRAGRAARPDLRLSAVASDARVHHGRQPEEQPAHDGETANDTSITRESTSHLADSRQAGWIGADQRLDAGAREQHPEHAARDTQRITLSVIALRTSRPRPAPSAVSTANSRWRVSARASSRFATLAQAMSSTNPTAACNTQIDSSGAAEDLVRQRRHLQRCGRCCPSQAEGRRDRRDRARE